MIKKKLIYFYVKSIPQKVHINKLKQKSNQKALKKKYIQLQLKLQT